MPTAFQAFVVNKTEEGFTSGFKQLSLDDLPSGNVLIKVAYSSVNYKDGLASIPDGKIVRNYPFVPGIDLAGIVADSNDSRFKAGDEVLVLLNNSGSMTLMELFILYRRVAERPGIGVGDADERGADQHDFAGEPVGRQAAVDQVDERISRDRAARTAIVDQEPHRRVGRHRQRTEPNAVAERQADLAPRQTAISGGDTHRQRGDETRSRGAL